MFTDAEKEREYIYAIDRFLSDHPDDGSEERSPDESVAYMNCTMRGRPRPPFRSLKLPVKAMAKYGVPVPEIKVMLRRNDKMLDSCATS